MGDRQRHDHADSIGRTVRDARRSLGLDQATTADIAGVSERFLRSLEHGKDTVQLRHLIAVCDVVGLDLQLVSRSIRSATETETGGQRR